MGEGAPGFRRIVMPTADLPAMCDFYGETLALPVRCEDESLYVQAGSTELIFNQVKGAEPYFHFAFNIPENRIHSACDWLKRRASVVRWANIGQAVFHFESWNAHAVYFIDPGGNILEFIARHGLRNAAPGPFSERDILYVSEFGWVVEDVGKAIKQVRQGLGLHPFRPAADDFVALGDEHAMVIVVKAGRTWFATDSLPAARFASSAELSLGWVGEVHDDRTSIVSRG